MGKRINDLHNWLGRFLSGQKITIVIVAACIVARVIQLVFFFNIRVDASYQVMATMHFVNGHGLSFGEVFANDLSVTHYETLWNWPPGYSILLAPFYLASGQNYIIAGIALDIVTATFLILISRSLLKKLEVRLYLRNIFTILTSFFIYSFYFVASSDAIAISFFIAAFYFYVSILKNSGSPLTRASLLALCLIACAWIKYLFIPVVFIIPILLFIQGRTNGNKSIKTSGIISFLILFTGVAILLVFQKLTAGSTGYISQPERGFFPGHLRHFYPFIPAAFLRPDTLDVFFKIKASIVHLFFQVIHLLVFVASLLWFSHYVYKKRFQLVSPREGFLYSSFFISLGIFLLLALLSLRVAREEILPGVFWTYIEETRYYGLVFVLIHLSLFIYFKWLSARLRMAFFFILLLLSTEAARGIFFTARRVMLLGKETYSWQRESKFQQYAGKVIQNALTNKHVQRVVIAGSSYYMNHRVSLHCNAPILYDQGKLNSPDLIGSRQPALLLVMLQESEMEKFRPFLDAGGKELAGQFNGFYFYTLYVGSR